LNTLSGQEGPKDRAVDGCAVLAQACFNPARACIRRTAMRGCSPPTGLQTREADAARHTLLYDGIERNLSMTVALSVVVPVKDEAENVVPLAREIANAVGQSESVEIIFVDDGSSDATPEVLKSLKAEIPALRVIRHAGNMGQSRAVRTGVRAARAGVIVNLDGDGQNDPADIPKLLALFHDNAEAQNIGLVSGVRVKRRDSLKKRLASRLANGFRRWMLNDGATDVGCGLKAFRRDAFFALPYFDHMHRYMVALMLREGYEVRFVEVNHRPRVHGRSKYGVWDRLVVGIHDLIGVRWLQQRSRGSGASKEI
jgi:dolichol-phosphate mannosyltransferase